MRDKACLGVSEITATLLLALIVIAVGGVVLINYYSSWSAEWHTYATSYERAVRLASEAMLSLVYGLYDVSSGELRLVLSVGSGEVGIDAIYVNDQLYWRSGEPGLSLNGRPVLEARITDTPAMAEVTVSKTIGAVPGEDLLVKIVTSAGNFYSFRVVVVE